MNLIDPKWTKLVVRVDLKEDALYRMRAIPL